MGPYFYLVASLPFLSYDSDAAHSVAAFRNLCREHMAGRDLRVLEAATLTVDPQVPPPPNRVLERFRRWETNLRNALVTARAARLRRDPQRDLAEIPFESGLPAIATDALAAASPLSTEHALDRARWSFLDGLEAGHSFDLDLLVIYCLKLQLVERRLSFDHDRGAERYASILTAVLEERKNGRSGGE